MTEAQFWKIIALLDWNNSGNDDAVVRPAVDYLSALPVEQIYAFENMLSEKLYLLDGEVFARNIGQASFDNNTDFFSVDHFLYVRACVVANGQHYFSHVLAHPQDMPKDMEFEALLSIAPRAYRQKTENPDFNFTPEYSYETFSNSRAWENRQNFISGLMAS